LTIDSTVLPVYRRADVQMQRGEGVYLFDTHGKKYLDFAAGIAVNALGHCHPHVVAALHTQTDTLWHCSNLLNHKGLETFSRRLADAAGLNSVFCCNSGTEAAEAAIKFVRRYHDKTGNHDKFRIIVPEGAFHGRTLAALSACRNPKAIEGYAPLVDCFDIAPFNDISALAKAITPETGAIMLEPIQGEGGIRPHSGEYLQAAQRLCHEHGLLLVLDEVQCGMGRAGSLFAFKEHGIAPDMVLVGKGLGNGFPLAACIVSKAVAAVMDAGSHGSTFGSNPLAMAVGNAVLDVMLEESFISRSNLVAEKLHTGLDALVQQHPQILSAWRGQGMMMGLVTKVSAYQLTQQLRESGLIVAPAGDGVVRLMPPLIITEAHVEEALEKLEKSFASWPN
jgi:acetylornithine/N-succinyldiaminopimelate aminotransferase